ncbi:DUF6884 domain-containing protein [Virgibacillus ihumii]|uniref:DUF6884 domain-containing protein n=1 Tax=Virgibacillus ihumii TaxID=2686091 RepID=UPI00157D3B7E|nr:DUF6884 domain-containing protein [Virgibacillus ihumii]
MKQLSIIPCGRKKIWDRYENIGAVQASDAYIGTLHHLCRNYAEAFTDDWVVLSAKHGFLFPEDIVPGQYNVTFNQKSDEIITNHKLREQVQKKQLDQYDMLVILTGKKYKPVINSAFNKDQPRTYPLLQYSGIGYMQQALKQAVQDNEPIRMKDRS